MHDYLIFVEIKRILSLAIKKETCVLPLSKSPNLVRIGCKTHVLHHAIRDCYISILLKIQYILPHLITSQQTPNFVGFIYGYYN